MYGYGIGYLKETSKSIYHEEVEPPICRFHLVWREWLINTLRAVNEFTDVLHKPQQRLVALLADNPAIDGVSHDGAGGWPVDFV